MRRRRNGAPVYGGLAGAAALCVPMLFHATSVGVSVYALILNAVIGFALPFYYLTRKQNAYDRACERELTALNGMSGPARQIVNGRGRGTLGT